MLILTCLVLCVSLLVLLTTFSKVSMNIIANEKFTDPENVE
jgi:hypothetical protein